MTTFKPGDRVYHRALIREGTVIETRIETIFIVKLDNLRGPMVCKAQDLESAGEPMSKRTDFLDADQSPMTIEGRADHANWAIKFDSTYREFTPADAPALALAILEAAGVERGEKTWFAPGENSRLEFIVKTLSECIEIRERKAKEAADREALEGEAWELATAHGCYGGNFRSFQDLQPTTQERWTRAALKAREMYAATA